MRHLTLLLSLSLSLAHGTTKRERFDEDWRFARFDRIPGGPIPEEPGAQRVLARASSERPDNPAGNAVDSDQESCWIASDATSPGWLIIDLFAVVEIGGVRIDRGEGCDGLLRIDVSEDGTQWREEVAKSADKKARTELMFQASARFVRIRVDSGTGTSPSLREVGLFDRNGGAIATAPSHDGKQVMIEDVEYDDSSWRSLDLPHDWAIEGPFQMSIENETGKLPWEGIGWYRKRFLVPEDLGDRRLFLDFDGAMSQPKVYVNGRLAGQWAYGYSSFRVEITDFVESGEAATVAVRLENLPQSTRWYPGAGLYRHVYLTTTPATAVAHWGVRVTTPEVRDSMATVSVETTVDHAGNLPVKLRVTEEVLDAGAVVASGTGTLAVGASGTAKLVTRLNVSDPKRWDLESPHLYDVRTRIHLGESLLDERVTRFGIRKIEWDAGRGFILNDRKVVLKGVCLHHDLGPLGSAVHSRAMERQLELLREMGANSIRTSHNPPAPEFLDACDRLGFLVIDELFDIWKLQKYGKINGYNVFWDEWHEKDVRNFMLRDRNHPSIIAWSTGNEVPELGRPDMHWVPERLRELIRRYDTSRPVTTGSNDPAAAKNGFEKGVDVFGVNYHIESYGATLDTISEKPVYASETSSTVSTRGEYFFPVSWDKAEGFYDFQVSSYDLYAPGWAYRPDLQFEALDKHPRLAGEYVWTGFDYLGEPTPYNQDQTNALNFKNPEERAKAMAELERLGHRAPSRSSYFGILDLCGFKKDRFFLYQSRWRPELPIAHILPHWNWPERTGQVVPVHVYTSGDEGELFLNGRSLGVRKKGEPHGYRLVWDDVVYEPGELRVVVRKGGGPWAEAAQFTTGPVAKLELAADRNTIAADGRDLSYLTIRALDSLGRLVPRTRIPVSIRVSGPLDIVGVCNGDPTDHTTMKPADPSVASISVFNGLAQVILRGQRDRTGTATMVVSPENLEAVETKVRTQAAATP